jgi:hypothetical protein
MTEVRKRMIECLQVRGLSERPQESYVRAVRQTGGTLSQVTRLVHGGGTAPVLPLSQERQALRARYCHHRHLRLQANSCA